jgi:hypothetical protein
VKRHVLDTGTATTAEGYTVTVAGLSEDRDAGGPSVANRGAVSLRIEGPDGFALELQLPGAESEKLVTPLVTGSIEHETQADVARRYLRDHASNLYPHQIESLKKQAGLPYDQDILDAALEAIAE